MNHGRIYLSCSCCAALVGNNARENSSHGVSPYPHDEGFGLCRSCGGDPSAHKVRDKMGWMMRCFVEARFPILRSRLRLANQDRWDQMSYGEKAHMVFHMVENGAMT